MDEPKDKLRVLLIEDDEAEAFLIKHLLNQTHAFQFDLDVRETLADGLERLAKGGMDVVLLDLGLPDSQGIKTYEKLVAARHDIPVVILTGFDDSRTAVEALKAGAQDYIVKGRVQPDMLARALRYAVERQVLHMELEKALAEVKALKGLLPICANCKKIRDDQGYWQQIEKYISEHSLASFSHGICPTCAITLYPDIFKTDEDTKDTTKE